MKKTVSLDHLPPKQRVEFWRTTLTDTYVPLDLANYSTEGFAMLLETAEFGNIEVSRLIGSEQDIHRPRHMIRSSNSDGFIAVLQLGGSMGFSHGDKEESGLSESITLFDTTKEYQAMLRGRWDVIGVSIPRQRIEALFGSTRDLAGLSLGADQPMTKLITEFFQSQMRIADQLSPEAAIRLGTIGGDLLAAAFLEKMGRIPGHGATGTAVMMKAKRYIRDHLGDRNLSPEIVAASQNLSLRRMQELFATESLSIGDCIWEQRLLHAYGMLRSKGLTRISVAEVAYAAGFVSLPHFARRFKARFGFTPIETRQRIG